MSLCDVVYRSLVQFIEQKELENFLNTGQNTVQDINIT